MNKVEFSGIYSNFITIMDFSSSPTKEDSLLIMHCPTRVKKSSEKEEKKKLNQERDEKDE